MIAECQQIKKDAALYRGQEKMGLKEGMVEEVWIDGWIGGETKP
jgi:hypothetical protein